MADKKTTATSAAAEQAAGVEADIKRALTAATESLTDNMIERLATTAANALEIVDRLNDDDTKQAMHTIIDRVTELHRSGALETLFDMVMLMHAARNAMSDNIVERLFTFMEYMLNNVATEEMADLADDVRFAVQEAIAESRTKPVKGGIMGTIRMLTDPEAQQTLQLLLLVGEKFRTNAMKHN